MSKSLTKEQQIIVKENHNLIYHFLAKRNLDADEWYGVIAEALIKTVMYHDADRGKLSTLFYRIAQNALSDEGKVRASIYESEKLVDFDSYSNFSNCPAFEDFYEIDLLSCLNDEELEIVSLTISGLNQIAICESLGFSRCTLWRRMSEIKLKLAEQSQQT